MQDKTGRIMYYLKNLDLEELIDRPYRIIEDMAIVFGYLKEDGMVVDPIDHKYAKENNWSDIFLWEMATKNTKSLLPAKIEPVYKNFVGHTEDEPVFFLTNEIQSYGSGTLLYDNLLQDFSMKYGWNLYLLPTSIHEFLLLFDQGVYSEEELLKIVKHSNENLTKEEFLSQNIYYYDREKGELISLF